MRGQLTGALVAGLVLAGCSSEPGPDTGGGSGDGADGDPRKVTLLLNWYPEAEHGGFYAAKVNGYFEEEGLDVEILPGGEGSPVIQQVAAGRVTFGVANADRVLLGRAQEADVVALMAPMQQSPRCVMVPAASGIESFEELQDVTLAIAGGGTWLDYLKAKYPLTNVRFVNGLTMAQFLERDDYTMQAYVFSEPFVAKEKGGDPRTLLVKDIGFSPYTSLLVTRGETLEDEELVRKMVRASVRGWVKYLAEPEETNAHIHAINPQMSLEALAYGVEALRPLCYDAGTTEANFGRMTAERWERLVSQMEEGGSLKPGAVRAAEAFTTEFLTAADAAGAK